MNKPQTWLSDRLAFKLMMSTDATMAGDPEESTVNCVDAWVAKLLDGKTLAESEVVQLCNKVRLRKNHAHVRANFSLESHFVVQMSRELSTTEYQRCWSAWCAALAHNHRVHVVFLRLTLDP